jgi:hypothetical protein
MTTRVTVICAVGAIWCAATAVRVAIALARRESYVSSWWEAGIAGTGRKLDTARTVIKLVTMLVVATGCALALADVLEPPAPLYIIFGAIGVAALSELSAPKPKRRR